MAKLETVTYLAEELIRQLPELYFNQVNQELFVKAVNILNELLIAFKKMEISSDIEMKEEIQEEELKPLEDGEIDIQSNISHSPVVINVTRKDPVEEKEKKEEYDDEEEYPDFQSDGSDEEYLSPKAGPKKPKRERKKKARESTKDEQFQVAFFLKYHSKDPVLYHCPLCETSFSSPDDLLCHDKEVHMNDVNEYKCPECDKANSKVAILQHYAKEHRKRNFKKQNSVERYARKVLHCPSCDQLFLNRQTLRKHHLDAHNKWCNNKTCLLCLKEFDKYKDAAEHEQLDHDNGKFCCRYKIMYKDFPNCNKEFTTNEELQQHYLTDHPIQETYTCHICGEFFTKQLRAKYLRHVQQHSMTEKTVECPECDKKFFFEVELNRHMSKHIKKYMCDICDYRTGWKTALENHMVRHSDEKPYVCNVCGMGFKMEYCLKKHSHTHSEVRNHKCEYCGKAFKMRKHLNEHTKIHTGKSGGYCEICKKSFTQKYNLTLHNLKHHQ